MITLTEKEISVIELYVNRQIEMPTGEDAAILAKVVNDADNLMRELNAYDELDGDLVSWYYNKYKQQSNDN